jgi:Asp/Glu/hydantoin racemase
MMTKPGKLPRNGYGESIGIIVAKIWYPALMRGHHNYCTTYDFPIRIKLIEDWVCQPAEKCKLPQWNVPAFVRCAKELEEEGVAAITTYCGMTGSIQEELTQSVEIPVFTSNLLQVPFVSRIIGKKKRVGILTASSEAIMQENKKALRQCGVDETIPIVVKGMVESDYLEIWRTQYCLDPDKEIDKKQYDPLEVEKAVVKATEELLSENPDVGAIVLECTEMPIYAKAVYDATGFPVFDSADLVRYVHSAINKSRYY